MTDNKSGFREQFSAWLGSSDNEDRRIFFQSGLIVFDTNALFALYAVSPTARGQLVNLLNQIEQRIWIPHQVGLEFARNRDTAARGGSKSWADAKVIVQNAEQIALRSLESAIEVVLDLRSSSMIDREWDRAAAKVDPDSLKSRLDGAMAPVIEELTTLRAEQDKSIKDLSRHDPVLEVISPVLAGRVGPPYNSADLRAIVEEAIDFRFPNEIPPGYKDKGKPTSLRAAGDYILWRQLIDKARVDRSVERVVFVTNDSKPDWWEVDGNGNPVRPHRELVQEMRDQANADILILSLTDFVTQARDSLSIEVSADTVDQIRSAVPIESEFGGDPRSTDSAHVREFSHLTPVEFEILVAGVLERMGFQIIERNAPGGPDFIVRRPQPEAIPIAVEAKKIRRDLSRADTYQLSGYMREQGIERGIFFTSSRVSITARARANRMSIDIIDGERLRELVDQLYGEESAGTDDEG